MIRDAGGVAVFAHPLARRRGRVVEPSVIVELAAAGVGGGAGAHPPPNPPAGAHPAPPGRPQ